MFVEMGISAAGNKSTPARSWRQALRSAIRDAHTLCARLELDPAAVNLADGAASQFPVFVPEEFLARMEPGNPADPLLRQVLPLAAEDQPWPGFGSDPLEEAAAAVVPGLLHKYHGRALLIVTGVCAVHCRYCFRRSFPYADQLAARNDFADALERLARDETKEAILSGGDPLSLGNARLESLLVRLAALPALRRVRLHTRFPIVLPDRVDRGLVALLERARVDVVVVLHTNHPREIDDDVARALGALKSAGVTLLNQSVLLRGINDDAVTLAELSERLFDCGALPYYLHLLDPVAGAAHFDVDETRAEALYRELLARLPGYLVPRLVREVPGQASKTPIRLGL